MKKITTIILVVLLALFVFLYEKDGLSDGEYTTNCYDHIIDYMLQPQYWNENNIPEYSTTQQQNEAETKLFNGTGFKYVEDEEDVVFMRGYQGELWLNFTNQSASTYFKKEFQLWASDKAYHYDIKHKLVYLEDLSDQKTRVDITSKLIRKDNDYNKYFNIYSEIEQTFRMYSDHFAEIGCPIMGIDKETFTTYKDINISVSEKDKKISLYPWLWDSWDDNIFETKSVTKLDDISDIWSIKRDHYSQTAIAYKDENNQKKEVYYYNPLFVIFKAFSTIDQYKLKDPNTSSYFEHVLIYEDLLSDFIIKYANEVCKVIYDNKACVYWIDTDKNSYLNASQSEPKFGMGKDDTESLKIRQGTVVTLYYYPKKTTIGSVLYNDAYCDMIYRTYDYLNDVLAYYGYPAIVDEQYVKNFILYYNLDWQRMLGLR